MKNFTINFRLNSSGVNSLPVQIIVNLGVFIIDPKTQKKKYLTLLQNLGFGINSNNWDKRKGLPIDENMAVRFLKLKGKLKEKFEAYEKLEDQDIIEAYTNGKLKSILKNTVDLVIHDKIGGQQNLTLMDKYLYKLGGQQNLTPLQKNLLQNPSFVGNAYYKNKLKELDLRIIDKKGVQINIEKFFNKDITQLEDMYDIGGMIIKDDKVVNQDDLYPIVFSEYILMVAEYKTKQIKKPLKDDREYKKLSEKFKKFNPKLTLGLISDNIVVDFLNWTKDNYDIQTVNSLGSVIKTIHAVLNYAIKFDKRTIGKKFVLDKIDLDDPLYDKMHEDVDNVYLNEKLLEQLSKVETGLTPMQIYIKQLFIVGSYTGVRFSDLKSTFNIQKYEDKDVYYLSFRDEKTNTSGKIPIPNFVHDIIKKYNFEFEEVTNKTFNLEIKEICRIAGLTQKYYYSKTNIKTNKKEDRADDFCDIVFAHTMRRNFATNMHYHRGIDKSVVKYILKMKKDETFDKYIKVRELQYIDSYIDQYIKVANL